MVQKTSGADALIDELGQMAFVTMAALSRVSSENGLSLTQLRMLGILRDREPRMADLANRLGLEKSTMSGLVDRAEQRGLISRTVSGDDARAMHVALTKKGQQLAKEVEAQVRVAFAPFIEPLDEKERKKLHKLLAKSLSRSGR